MPRIRLFAAVLALVAAVAGCSRADGNDTPAAATDKGPATELRLGYFPNVTHAAALVGLDKGLFTKELGSTKLVPTKFNAGPEAVGALLGGSLDASFIGSGPAINAYAKSNGEAVRLIAGTTSGGAQLVVKPTITKAEDLVGKTVVTPQLGNTQDVSLKKWLAEKNLTGKVKVTNLENAQTLDAFKKGDVDAAWLPEPWSSRLVLDAGAKVLLDEATLWPDGKFPTTVLIVRTQFLQEHPESVKALLTGLVGAIDFSHHRQGGRPDRGERAAQGADRQGTEAGRHRPRVRQHPGHRGPDRLDVPAAGQGLGHRGDREGSADGRRIRGPRPAERRTDEGRKAGRGRGRSGHEVGEA